MTNDRFLVEAMGLVLRHGRKVATRGIDLAVPRGSVTALLGRNGAGKSTFLDACMGLIPVTQGSLRVFGGNALGRIVAPRSYLASGVHLFTATEWACQFALLFGATFYCGLMSPRSAGAVSGLIIIVFGANVFGRVADEVWLNHWEVPEQALPTIQNWWLASLGLGFGLAAWQVMTRSDLHRGRLLRPLAISVPVLILSLVPSAAFGHRQLMTWVETLPTDPVVKIESIALLMTNDGPRLSLIMKKPGFRRALEGILIDPSTGASTNLGFARYLVSVALDGKSLLGIDVHPRLGSIKDSEYGRWVADASGQSLPAENWPPHRRSHRHALGVFENWQVRLTQTGSKVGILVVDPVGDVAAHHIPHGDEFGHRLFGSRVWMIRGGQRNEGTPPDLVSLDLRTGAETTRAFPEAQARRAAIPEWNVIV
ncbi:MAG: ATP-binding cassette domain-containing protein, partial [Planctomycetes bacterium]|nr:ATP-binding cassette domain-containing protein [Planctomycetota bacterium]